MVDYNSPLEAALAGQGLSPSQDVNAPTNPVTPLPVERANRPVIPSRSLGQVAWDTGIAGLEGLARMGEDVSAGLTGEHQDAISNWLDSYKTDALKAMQQREAEDDAAEDRADAMGNADAATRFFHHARRFLRDPLQNLAGGAGYIIPGAIATALTDGGAGAALLEGAALGGGSLLDAHNRALASNPNDPLLSDQNIAAGLTGAAMGPLGRASGSLKEGLTTSLAGSEARSNFEQAMAAAKEAEAAGDTKLAGQIARKAERSLNTAANQNGGYFKNNLGKAAITAAIDGGGNASIGALAAAANGEDPAAAAGDNIAPALTFAGLHGIQGGLAKIGNRVGDGYTGLRNRFGSSDESSDVTEPEEAKDNVSNPDNSEDILSDTISPTERHSATRFNEGTVEPDENAPIVSRGEQYDKGEKSYFENNVDDANREANTANIDGLKSYLRNEKGITDETDLNRIVDSIYDQSVNANVVANTINDNLHTLGEKLFSQDKNGEPVLREDDADPKDINEYLNNVGRAMGNSQAHQAVSDILEDKNGDISKNYSGIDRSLLEGARARTEQLTQFIHGNYGNHLEAIAQGITPEEFSHLSAANQALLISSMGDVFNDRAKASEEGKQNIKNIYGQAAKSFKAINENPQNQYPVAYSKQVAKAQAHIENFHDGLFRRQLMDQLNGAKNLSDADRNWIKNGIQNNDNVSRKNTDKFTREGLEAAPAKTQRPTAEQLRTWLVEAIQSGDKVKAQDVLEHMKNWKDADRQTVHDMGAWNKTGAYGQDEAKPDGFNNREGFLVTDPSHISLEKGNGELHPSNFYTDGGEKVPTYKRATRLHGLNDNFRVARMADAHLSSKMYDNALKLYKEHFGENTLPKIHADHEDYKGLTDEQLNTNSYNRDAARRFRSIFGSLEDGKRRERDKSGRGESSVRSRSGRESDDRESGNTSGSYKQSSASGGNGHSGGAGKTENVVRTRDVFESMHNNEGVKDKGLIPFHRSLLQRHGYKLDRRNNTWRPVKGVEVPKGTEDFTHTVVEKPDYKEELAEAIDSGSPIRVREPNSTATITEYARKELEKHGYKESDKTPGLFEKPKKTGDDPDTKSKPKKQKHGLVDKDNSSKNPLEDKEDKQSPIDKVMEDNHEPENEVTYKPVDRVKAEDLSLSSDEIDKAAKAGVHSFIIPKADAALKEHLNSHGYHENNRTGVFTKAGELHDVDIEPDSYQGKLLSALDLKKSWRQRDTILNKFMYHDLTDEDTNQVIPEEERTAMKNYLQAYSRNMYKTLSKYIENNKKTTDSFLEFGFNHSNAYAGLLDKEGKNIDPHVIQAMCAATLHVLLKHDHQRDLSTATNGFSDQQIKTRTVLDQIANLTPKLLGIRPSADTPVTGLYAPFAHLSAMFLEGINDLQGTRVRLRTELDNGKKVSVIKDIHLPFDGSKDIITNIAFGSHSDEGALPYTIGQAPKHSVIPAHASPDDRDIIKEEDRKAFMPSDPMLRLVRTFGDKWGNLWTSKTSGKLRGYKSIIRAKEKAAQAGADLLMDVYAKDGKLVDDRLPMFFRTTLQASGRFGKAGSLNPIDSKTLRAALTSWTDKITKGEETDDWKRAFAQALGFKLERNSESAAIKVADEEINKFLSDEDGGFKIFKAAMSSDATKRQAEDLKDYMHKRFGTDFDPFTVMALAELTDIHDKGSVESRLPISVDGITNGVSTANSHYNRWDKPENEDILARSGVFVRGSRDKTQQDGDLKDHYVNAVVGTNLKDLDKDKHLRMVYNLLRATGAVDEEGNITRSFIKQPLQMSTYMVTEKGLQLHFIQELRKEAAHLIDEGRADELLKGYSLQYGDKNTRLLEAFDLKEDKENGRLIPSDIPHADYAASALKGGPRTPLEHAALLIAKETLESARKSLNEETYNKITFMNHVHALITELAGSSMKDYLNKHHHITYGELKELRKDMYGSFPYRTGIDTGEKYIHEDHQTFQTPNSAIRSPFLKKENTNNQKYIGLRKTLPIPTGFNHRDNINKGFGVSEIQNLGDVASIHALFRMVDPKNFNQVFDGIYARPSKAYEVARALNTGWSDALNTNSFKNLIQPLKKLLSDLGKYSAEGTESRDNLFGIFGAFDEAFDKSGFLPDLEKGDSYFNHPDMILNKLKELSKEQDQELENRKGIDAKFEQYSAGSKSAVDSSVAAEAMRQQDNGRQIDKLIMNMRDHKGHVSTLISRILSANRDFLKKTDLLLTDSREEADNFLGRGDNAFRDNENLEGGYDPNTNRLVVVTKGKSDDEVNRILLHELTHTLTMKNIYDTGMLDGPNRALTFARRQLHDNIEQLLNSDDFNGQARKDLRKYMSWANDNKSSSDQLKNAEFAAYIFSSPELLEHLNKIDVSHVDEKDGKKSFLYKTFSRMKRFLIDFGKTIFGIDSLGKKVPLNTLAGFSLRAINSATEYRGADVESKRNIPPAYATQANMYDSADEYNNRRIGVMTNIANSAVHTDFLANTGNAYSHLNALKNAGWKFTPDQERLFLHTHAQATDPAMKDKAAPFLRTLAPLAEKLIEKNGADYLGSNNKLVNLLALTQSHPLAFANETVKPWFTKTGVSPYASKFGTGINAFDHSNILKATDAAGSVLRYIDKQVKERLDDAIASGIHKYTGKSTEAADVEPLIKQVSKDIASLADNSKIPTPLRELMKNMVAVTDDEVPLLHALRMSRYHLDQFRQKARQVLPVSLEKTFTKVKLTNADRSTLDKVLRTDIGRHPKYRDIILGKTEEPTLKAPVEAIKAADALARHLATGKAEHNLHVNALSISKAFGGDRNAIDAYVSEKAYRILPEDIQKCMRNLIAKDKDGVESIFGYHAQLITRNHEGASTASRLNALKGYLPSEYRDAGFNILAAKKGSEEYKHLINNLGYTEFQDYVPNPGEADGKGYVILTGRSAGNIASNQGGLSRIKNSVGGYNPENKTVGQFTIGRTQMYGAYNYKGAKLRPIFDNNGKISHYERQFDLPDKTAFAKNDNAFENLGIYEGNLGEMAVRDSINRVNLTKLKEMYTEDGSPKNYVNVAASNDPVIKQAWKALPYSVKKQASEIFGKENFLPIKRSLVNDVLGYKKASVGDFFTGDTRWSPQVQKTVVAVAHKLLGTKAFSRLMTAERILESATATSQRMIAIASVRIPVRNMSNDILQLMSQGIPLKTIISRGVEITKDIQAYRKSQVNIYNLKAAMARRDLSKEQLAKYSARISVEKERCESLKTWPLIRDGLYSVVDDGLIGNRNGGDLITPYIDKGLDLMPDAMKTIGNNLLATRDSALFKAIQNGVETGDFIARVLTFENEMAKGSDYEAAVQKAASMFVDFGRSKGRTREKLESMGLAWFWNTKLASLGIAGNLLRDNPFLALVYTHAPTYAHYGFLNNLATPVTDNILSQGADGKLGFSLGWGQLGSGYMMNPVLELLN